MRDCSSGEVLLCLVCLMLLSSVESFNWTVEPTNPTQTIKGQDVSLTWNYSLTADELLDAHNFYLISWRRLTQSSSDYVLIASKTFLVQLESIIYDEKQPRVMIDINDPSTLHIKDVRREDEGTYKIDFVLKTGENAIADHKVNLTVLERSEIGDVSNQAVCEGNMVTLNCNATGKPTPNITWTRVWENGTDSEQLQVVDGNYVMNNITRSSNGTYRCTAYNGVGVPVNRTVDVIVGYSASVVSIVSSSNTVTEGDTYNLSCEVSGYPMPTVTWIKESNDQRSDGNILNFTNITRSDSGDYRCEAENRCGKKVKNASINVFYKPDTVTLETNNTENKDCSDLWVNFTCISSEANPPVDNYRLFEDGKGLSFSKSGTWIEKISRRGKVISNCVAYNLAGNVTNTNNVTLTVNVPISMKQVENKIVEKEGDSVEVHCNVTGFPDPTVIWKNVKTDVTVEGNLLNITNITRAQAGEYRCIANNSCGNESTVVDIDVQFVAKLTNVSGDHTVREGLYIQLVCEATGNPTPNITWTRVLGDNSNSEVLHHGPTWNFPNINRTASGTYRCTAYNGVGNSPSQEIKVNVTYPPENVHLSTNITNKVCTGIIINFTCSAEANPPVHTYLVYENGTVIRSRTRIKTMDTPGQFVFRCEANNSVQGTGRSSDTILLTVGVPASVHVEPAENKIVKTEGKNNNVEVYCNGTGFPDPTVIWKNVTSGHFIEGNPLNITNITRAQAGEYRCIANNTCKEASTVVDIDVQYPPSVNTSKGDTFNVTEGSNASISCPVDGNPRPNITWDKENSSAKKIEKRTLEFYEVKLSDGGSYTCSAKNCLGTITVKVTILIVAKPPTTTSSTPTTEEGGIKVQATATIEESCDKRLEVAKEFPTMCCELNKDNGCVSAKATDSRCGSVIIDFVMNFNQSVDGNKVLDVLKVAAEEKKFGNYTVNSINLIASSSTVTPAPDLSGFFTNKDGSIKIGIAIGIAVVGVVIICAIVACGAWCVHKKRNCRKDARVHSVVEEQPLSGQDGTRADENPYAHDNNGYAVAGPQSEQSQGASGPAAVPTYAVVDKSTKKGKKDKKKDKQAAEQKPTEDQYAVVDKSKKKKKKKEEPDATYAQVDMSKKSKKKAKPGECLYADLGDFNQMREMPKVSTSPEVLPPIKKPTPYAETEYADITQFLKGDAKLPGSNNSQGQATKTDSNSPGQATLANSNSSQGHATLANSNSSQGQATLANSNSSQGQATLANSNSSQGPATDTKNTGDDGKDGRANNETCL